MFEPARTILQNNNKVGKKNSGVGMNELKWRKEEKGVGRGGKCVCERVCVCV